MKKTRTLLLTGFACSMIVSAVHGISITSLQTLDSGYMPRTNFSNTETITLKVDCLLDTNATRVNFKFYISDPSGRQVFFHEGNSMPGTMGTGGTELRNIPIDFYTKPGNYTVRAEAIADGVTATNTAVFAIISQNISLIYPPNESRDIMAQPLIFQWGGSGATRYRVTVGDNAGFYKPLWTGEAYTTQIEYPKEPTDVKAKLAGGTVYYWKVDGLDSMDRIVAETASPYSFTIKTVDSSDLGVLDILLSDMNTPEALMLNVTVKNLGSKAESNINVDLVIVGGNIIPTQSISSIQSGEAKDIFFNCGSVTGEAITVSATINIFDDNPRNNILTKVIRIPIVEKAKILGGVTEKASGNSNTAKAVADASVIYSGPLNGTVKTNPGGQYKIENLVLGEYSIKVTHPDYQDSEAQTVSLNTHKAYPNIDFVLAQKEKEQAKEKTEEKKQEAAADVTPQELLNIVQDLIKNKKVIDEFEGFNLVQIELEPSTGNMQAIFQQLKNKKAAILTYKVEEVKE
ncbi:MAG: hypothetical protein A2297_02920 [Elusimicrobia bacterium RIFOXYB2_FULL_48_7]|nr:MAG: hypothetical protein A2297_02920 [Elusimicrobia bacterium RIFOXYB2_FULL_48_7]